MVRYFIELAYKGTRYGGFQIQQNANTVQAEVEKAINTLYGSMNTNFTGDGISLTGSSRTDAGVHALQNYFHFDVEQPVDAWKAVMSLENLIYKLNAILPVDIVVKNIHLMHPDAHCRFDALSREYVYNIHSAKNPFLRDTSFYYPFKLNEALLQEAAAIIKEQTNFFAFAKTNTQVKNFNCVIQKSEWDFQDGTLTYTIAGNRFLRGMVRLLTASILKVGRGNLAMEEFHSLFQGSTKCGYSVPAHGLFLKKVRFPNQYFIS